MPAAFEAADRMAEDFDLDAPAVKLTAALKLPPKQYAADPANAAAAVGLLGALESAEDFAAASRLAATLQLVPGCDPVLRAALPKRAKEIERAAGGPRPPGAGPGKAEGRARRPRRQRGRGALRRPDARRLGPRAADAGQGRQTRSWRPWPRSTSTRRPALRRRRPREAGGRVVGPGPGADRPDEDDPVGAGGGRLPPRPAGPGGAGAARWPRGVRRKPTRPSPPPAAGDGRRGGPGRRVHLLPLIEDQDLAKAEWSRQGAVVVSHDHNAACLTLPYLPPAEYDFSAEFSRLSGNDDVLLAVPGRHRDVRLRRRRRRQPPRRAGQDRRQVGR